LSGERGWWGRCWARLRSHLSPRERERMRGGGGGGLDCGPRTGFLGRLSDTSGLVVSVGRAVRAVTKQSLSLGWAGPRLAAGRAERGRRRGVRPLPQPRHASMGRLIKARRGAGAVCRMRAPYRPCVGELSLSLSLSPSRPPPPPPLLPSLSLPSRPSMGDLSSSRSLSGPAVFCRWRFDLPWGPF
jgi:hypothetical protein